MKTGWELRQYRRLGRIKMGGRKKADKSLVSASVFVCVRKTGFPLVGVSTVPSL